MINYIKKVVSAQSERYLIETNNKSYNFSYDDKDLVSFLNNVKNKLVAEILRNKNKIKRIKSEIPNYGEKNKIKENIVFGLDVVSILATIAAFLSLGLIIGEGLFTLIFLGVISSIAVTSLTDQFLRKMLTNPEIRRSQSIIDELKSELELVNSLGRHINAKKSGQKIENDIFSEDYYSKNVGLIKKIGILLGSRPTNKEEYKIHKENSYKKIRKIIDSENKINDKKNLVNKDISSLKSLRIKNGTIKNIYVGRLRELIREKDKLNSDSKSSAFRLKLAKIHVDFEITDAAIAFADLYPYRSIEEIRPLVSERIIQNNPEYRQRRKEYVDSVIAYKNSLKNIEDYKKSIKLKKLGILRELLEYKKLIKKEINYEGKKYQIKKSLDSYSRVYKK